MNRDGKTSGDEHRNGADRRIEGVEENLWRRAAAEVAEEYGGSHPSPEMLSAYVEGLEVLTDGEKGSALDVAEVEGIRDHLVGCSFCRALVSDLSTFPDLDPPSPEQEIGDEDQERAWRRLEQHLKLGEPGPSALDFPDIVGATAPGDGGRGPAERQLWRSTFWRHAALVVVGLGLLAWALLESAERRRLAGLLSAAEGDGSPVLAAAELRNLVTSAPPATPYRSEGTFEVLEVPQQAGGVLWALDLAPLLDGDGAAEPPFSVEMSTPGGDVVWTVDGLEAVELGILSFVVPRRNLSAGDFVLRLQTQGGAPLAEYPVRVVLLSAT
ncbi:MAG: hypothetical protein AAGD06_10165 [Acidobacteriota bacterium]